MRVDIAKLERALAGPWTRRAIYFKPIFELGLFCSERSGHEDKLGGLPFGLPLDRWPVCGL
jgi:hypothetical protein